MRRPLLFLPLAGFHARYKPVDKFRQSKAGWGPLGYSKRRSLVDLLHLANSIRQEAGFASLKS